jgi:ketosteroid isomerase-like protein
MPATETAEETVRGYYDALRDGDVLPAYFADDEETFKFGITERLFGYDAVEEALREQTSETENWTVESKDLRVKEEEGHAFFSDIVRMAWENTEKGRSYDFETRWSGTLERLEDDGWVFVCMHVSAEPEPS